MELAANGAIRCGNFRNVQIKAISLLLFVSTLSLISQPIANALVTVTATGSTPTICNQSVDSDVGVTATRLASGYCVIRFTSTSTTTWKVPPQITSVSLLVIGGGGAGGARGGGGGGAGGYISVSQVVSPGTSIAISVGAGGIGNATQDQHAANGANTSVVVSDTETVTAIGGGGGGGANAAITGQRNGDNGGSGGGSTLLYVAGPSANTTVGLGTSGQGNNGGGALNAGNNWPAGGGGGAGGAGQSPGSNTKSGSGGAGLASAITGTNTCYATGGGGGINSGQTGGDAGTCSGFSANINGGAGGAGSVTPATPTSNTGAGGGAAGYNESNADVSGGTGASGVVVISYVPPLSDQIAISSPVLSTTNKAYPFSQDSLTVTSVTGGSGSGALSIASVSSGTATNCLWNGTTLTATSSGTCTLTISKAADSNYNAATTSATFTFDPFTISYNKGPDGTGVDVSQVHVYPGSATLKNSADAKSSFTRTGYSVTGWTTGSTTGSAKTNDLGSTYSSAANLTLYPVWSIDAYTLTYNANGGITGTSSVTVQTGSSAVLPTPTRANYHFDAWFDESSSPATQISGPNYSPISNKTLVAHWTQNSLYGVGAYTDLGSVTVIDGYGGSFSANNSTSSVSLTYPINALPAGTFIHGHILNDPTSVSSSIPGTNSYVVAMVVAWNAPDGTVPATDTGTALTMTMTNSSIKKGAKVYKIIAGVATYVMTATSDGTVTVSLTEDPQVVVVITKSDAPTGVTASSGGNSSSTVSWSAPAINGGAAITEYTATSSGGQHCSSATTSCSVTGLTNGSSYTFTVTATNSVGTSDASAASSAISPVAPAPAPVPSSSPIPAPAVPDPAIAAAKAAAELKAANEKAAAELKAAKEKAAAELKAAAEETAAQLAELVALRLAQELVDDAARATAERKAVQDKEAADARIAEELRIAKAKADAILKAAAEQKAAEDELAAAANAAKKITPSLTLYSVSNSLKLSTYDLAYLKKFISKLKPTAKITCIGYIYTHGTTAAKAKQLATNQAAAVCKIIRAQKKTLVTSIVLYSSSTAPKAAVGSRWVAVSYRIDGFAKYPIN